jgi:hypothetical protein
VASQKNLCAILERNLKDYVGLWKLERHGDPHTPIRFRACSRRRATARSLAR